MKRAVRRMEIKLDLIQVCAFNILYMHVFFIDRFCLAWRRVKG